jgi:Zn-dependent protease/predicted transcriptional regulator
MATRSTTADRPELRGAAEERSGGFRLGRISGIQVMVDWSLLIIFAMIVMSLGWQLLPVWHPEWRPALRWMVAVVAAISFFASILAHELSHALVGRRQGVRVERITLFLFGGVAHMEDEARSPKAELTMAIVGPITSLVIGAVSLAIAMVALDRATAQLLVNRPEEAIHALGPGSTILLWLGPINIALAIFNLVPGFPLDGGRVFRAIAWWATGDQKKATRWASRSGQGIAVLLMAIGVTMAMGIQVPPFGRGLVPGLWLLFIGWFLFKAAQAGYGQLLLREALQHVHVGQIMRRRFDSVAPDVTIDRLMTEYVLQSDQEVFPIILDGKLLGLISARDAVVLPANDWLVTRVSEVMTPIDRVPTVQPDDDVQHALPLLDNSDNAQLPVIEHGELRGFLRQRDVLKWLALRQGNVRRGDKAARGGTPQTRGADQPRRSLEN